MQENIRKQNLRLSASYWDPANANQSGAKYISSNSGACSHRAEEDRRVLQTTYAMPAPLTMQSKVIVTAHMRCVCIACALQKYHAEVQGILNLSTGRVLP